MKSGTIGYIVGGVALLAIGSYFMFRPPVDREKFANEKTLQGFAYPAAAGGRKSRKNKKSKVGSKKRPSVF
jgi:hypothetical protein